MAILSLSVLIAVHRWFSSLACVRELHVSVVVSRTHLNMDPSSGVTCRAMTWLACCSGM